MSIPAEVMLRSRFECFFSMTFLEGGATIQRLAAETGARIFIEKGSGLCKVSGTREQVAEGVQAVGRRKLKPIESRVESAWFQCLNLQCAWFECVKLKYDYLLSNCAFNYNLRHHKAVRMAMAEGDHQKGADKDGGGGRG